MVTLQSITTSEQLLTASGLGRCELVRGNLVMMSPSGFRHGRIAATVARLLGEFVSENDLGVVTGAETGFRIEQSPDTVRAPDVAFVTKERLPDDEPVGFFAGGPNLAVEVLSPNDQASEVTAKVEQWLQHECEEVWVADPDTESITIHLPGKQPCTFDRTQTVTSLAVKGFQVAVSRLFRM